MVANPAESGVPLYLQIKRLLREAIARGEYSAGLPFTTQREVCEQFGVSTATAVRVLNELVGEGVLVRKRGRGTFVSESAARPTPASTPRTDSIALIIHGKGPHQSLLLEGIGSVCAEQDYRVFVSDSTPSADHERRAISQALDSGVSGILLYPLQGQPNLAALAEVRRRRVPLVLLDRHLPSFPCDAVLADNFSVGYQLTKELISRGHRRIATLWSEFECTSVYDRLTGHTQALREYDLPIRPDFTALRSYTDLPEEQRKAFLTALFEASDPPSLVLCANGLVLATAAHDLVGLGLCIPDEVDLAGMDNAGPFDLLPLTCIAAVLPSRDMGIVATRMLLERIGSDDPHLTPQHRVLGITLRHRESAQAQLRPFRTADTAINRKTAL
jgi:GntR family transcriptional regulator, arabinose operon transcriptional repressor